MCISCFFGVVLALLGHAVLCLRGKKKKKKKKKKVGGGGEKKKKKKNKKRGRTLKIKQTK
eukprot:NODE_14113_length_1127_cov_8.148000.p10 GENE.NODE_14113_length_1127_cov_8.148000~~NODE_14113_length_1127_cov_8.148000.p10  ORF type:complete len:60 (-),score=29.23 NODE_14113_length_1127_cov_8.148000:34-213(-)